MGSNFGSVVCDYAANNLGQLTPGSVGLPSIGNAAAADGRFPWKYPETRKIEDRRRYTVLLHPSSLALGVKAIT